MTFATVSVNREQSTLLSQLLLTVFPGCTIYRSSDPMRAIQHLTTRKADAVFADVEISADLIHILKGKKWNTPVYLLCGQDLQTPEEEDVSGILTYPLTKQKIQIALQSRPREFREVV